MTILEVVIACRNTLNGIAPAYRGDKLNTDALGEIIPPSDDAFFVVWLLTSTPTVDWGKVKWHDSFLRVSAWAIDSSVSLDMHNSAETALRSAGFWPRPLSPNGKDGQYWGYTREVELQH